MSGYPSCLKKLTAGEPVDHPFLGFMGIHSVDCLVRDGHEKDISRSSATLMVIQPGSR